MLTEFTCNETEGKHFFGLGYYKFVEFSCEKLERFLKSDLGWESAGL